MIDRLQSSFDKQVQFVSDASHELRTPITVIQGYANLLDRWGKDDREALEKSIYKFTPKDGVIDISSETQDNLLKITVSDTGIGIPKDEIEREHFFHLISAVIN